MKYWKYRKYLMMLAALPLGFTDYILWNILMIQEYGYRTLKTAIKENYYLLMEPTHKGDTND